MIILIHLCYSYVPPVALSAYILGLPSPYVFYRQSMTMTSTTLLCHILCTIALKKLWNLLLLVLGWSSLLIILRTWKREKVGEVFVLISFSAWDIDNLRLLCWSTFMQPRHVWIIKDAKFSNYSVFLGHSLLRVWKVNSLACRMWQENSKGFGVFDIQAEIWQRDGFLSLLNFCKS